MSRFFFGSDHIFDFEIIILFNFANDKFENKPIIQNVSADYNVVDHCHSP